jgi:hypothetical protein
MWAFHKWSTSSIVIIGSGLLGLWGVLNFIGAIHVAVTSRVFFGEDLPEIMKELRKYRLLSTSPILIFNRWCGYCGLLIFAESLLIEISWIGISLSLLGMATFNSARFVQPPFALVLGVSNTSGRDTARIAVLSARPHQVTNLMEFGKNRDLLDAYAKGTTRRIGTEFVSWKQAVFELAEIAKIVVFDARVLSKAVQDEFDILSSMDVLFKTVFILDSVQSPFPAYFPDDVILRLKEQSKIVDLEHLSVLISSLKKHPELVPTRENPIMRLGTPNTTPNSSVGA